MKVAELLKENEFESTVVHEDIDDEVRDDIFVKYRLGEIKIIVTTEVLKKQYAHNKDFIIINYDLPALGSKDEMNRGRYLLRIKSSGSLGTKGLVVSFLLPSDTEYVEQLMRELESSGTVDMQPLPEDLK